MLSPPSCVLLAPGVRILGRGSSEAPGLVRSVALGLRSRLSGKTEIGRLCGLGRALLEQAKTPHSTHLGVDYDSGDVGLLVNVLDGGLIGIPIL